MVELQAPGSAVGGFVAAVCFLLFFWSHYLGGTAGWLEVTLFVAGVACLLLEVFVIPGFGIFGLGGGAMVLASIILASQTSGSLIPHNDYQFEQLQSSLLTVAAVGLGVIVLAALLAQASAALATVRTPDARAAGRRRGRNHPPPRGPGRFPRSGGHARHGHHATNPQRQGPLRRRCWST